MTSAIEWKNRGNSALSSGNHQDAIDCYTKAIELDNKQHVYYSNRSAAYLSNDNPDKALEDATKCIELSPKWVKGYARQGAALHKQGKYEEALKAYENGLEIDKTNEACLNGIQEIKKIQSNPPANPFANMFGPDMFAKIQLNPRISHYLNDPSLVSKLNEIQKDPSKMSNYMSDQRIMNILMELMGLNMNMPTTNNNNEKTTPETATSNFKKETSPEPEPTMSNENEKKKPKTKDMEETFDPNMTSDEIEAEKCKRKGNEFYKNKDFSNAIDQYNMAIEKNKKNISYLTNRAAAKFELKEYQACIQDCLEAIKVGRENRADYAQIAKAYVRIANAYLKLSAESGAKVNENENEMEDDTMDENEEEKDTEEIKFILQAIENFENAQMENRTKDVDLKLKSTSSLLKKKRELNYINPKKAVKDKEKGNEFFKNGDYPNAVKCYTEAIKRDPKNEIYYANRAAALTKLTSFNDAKKDCEIALELNPKYVKAYSRKGAIEFFMKEYHKARETYEKGLALDPENSECKDGLNRVIYEIQRSAGNGEIDQERAAHGLADPEIQSILRDPIIQNILQEFQTDPRSAQRHLQNPEIMKKIEKLIAAGVLQTK